jgi:hypothetical protein
MDPARTAEWQCDGALARKWGQAGAANSDSPRIPIRREFRFAAIPVEHVQACAWIEARHQDA